MSLGLRKYKSGVSVYPEWVVTSLIEMIQCNIFVDYILWANIIESVVSNFGKTKFTFLSKYIQFVNIYTDNELFVYFTKWIKEKKCFQFLKMDNIT